MSDLSDQDLVERCRAGQQECFDHLVRRHQREIYRLCFRLTGRHEEADDLAQEAFVRAYQGIKSFRGDASFKTWLHKIVVNLSINRRKKTGREETRTVPLDEASAGSEPTALSDVIERQRKRRMREAVGGLPPRQRETLVLRLYKEMKFAEIARVMGCSVGTAKANFFHAIVNLKRALSG